MFSGVLNEGSLPGHFFFCSRRCFSAVSHPQQYSIATSDTVVPMNTEVPTKYLLSHNDRIIVFEIHLHSKSLMLYRPTLHGNWNALSLARRALKDKFPTPTIPLTAVLPNCQVFLPEPVYYILLLIVILLCSWLYICIGIYTIQLCITVTWYNNKILIFFLIVKERLLPQFFPFISL